MMVSQLTLPPKNFFKLPKYLITICCYVSVYINITENLTMFVVIILHKIFEPFVIIRSIIFGAYEYAMVFC